MAEYIEREIIRNLLLDYYGLRDAYKSNYRGNTLKDYEVHYMLEDCCDNAPAADVVEVRHGKWELVYDETGNEAFGFKEITVSGHRCSICLKSVDVSEGHFCYCPNCGAKMDGKWVE